MTSIYLVYEPHGLKYQIDGTDYLPGVGDTVKNNDLTYIVKEVVYNYDRSEIRINLKRPEVELIPPLEDDSTTGGKIVKTF